MANKHAATKVCPNVAVLKMNIVNVRAFGKREQARIGNRLPKISSVIKPNNVVTVAVKRTLKRIVLISKRKRSVRFNNLLELAAFLVKLIEVDVIG